MIGPASSSASLQTAQSRLLTAMEVMASGSSINSAADNPAGLAQSESYSVQISGNAQAMNNIQNGLSLLDTAGGAFDQIGQGLQDIRALTVQAGDGSLGASDLQAIQEQIGQISQGIDQIAGSTQFNGQNLLDGRFSQALQTGANAGQTQNVALGNFSAASLGVANLDVTTPAGQASALSALDAASQAVSDSQANLGALAAGLNASLSNLGAASENLAAANSRVSDADYAKASSDQAQANVQQQASLQALATYNSLQGNVLTLLPK